MMRVNVPHRQMLPSRALLTCRRVGFGYFSSERHGRHDEARRAEPAHQRVAVAEGLLHRVQRRAVRRGRPRCGSACPAPRWPASSTSTPCVPSMIIVQAPQTPRSQPRLLPVMSAVLRIASSSVTRGSTFRFNRLPLTMSVIGTSPGPTTRAALRFELGDAADHTGRKRRDASGLQERPASDVDARARRRAGRRAGIVCRSH